MKGIYAVIARKSVTGGWQPSSVRPGRACADALAEAARLQGIVCRGRYRAQHVETASMLATVLWSARGRDVDVCVRRFHCRARAVSNPRRAALLRLVRSPCGQTDGASGLGHGAPAARSRSTQTEQFGAFGIGRPRTGRGCSRGACAYCGAWNARPPTVITKRLNGSVSRALSAATPGTRGHLRLLPSV